MGLYTKITRDWLEQRFAKRTPAGVYFAHMPVYGLGHPDAEGGHLRRYARILRVLQQLDGLRFGSLLDVGGAEGYVAHAAARILGCEATSVDLSLEASLRARELFGLPSAAVDCWRLPFADGAFDVVLCSEVIEHVEHPVETLLELQRVARVAVVLTTEELHYDRGHIDAYLWKRPGWPHMERNLFHPDDLRACLPTATLRPQCDREPEASALPRAETVAWILANTRADDLRPGRIGVTALIPGPEFAAQPRRHADGDLLERLLDVTVAPGARAAPPTAATEARFRARLRDPITRQPLREEAGALAGSRHYALRDGVPDFVDVDAAGPAREALAARVRDLPHGEALLALRDKLYLFDRVAGDALDLTQRAAQKGFWPNEQLQPRGEGFAWRATGDDPWLVTPCLQRRLRAVHVDLRVHAPGLPIDALTGQVFWKGPADETFTEPASVKFRLRNDGARRTYRVDLAANPALPAEVQWLRLDLADAPCEIDLYGLRFEA
ncbi:MAG: class I SAM-dependent methyltransferase [Planctomycetota bacterium]